MKRLLLLTALALVPATARAEDLINVQALLESCKGPRDTFSDGICLGEIMGVARAMGRVDQLDHVADPLAQVLTSSSSLQNAPMRRLGQSVSLAKIASTARCNCRRVRPMPVR